MNGVTTKTWRVVWELILPVALVVIWWFWSAASTNMYFPPLGDILDSFGRTWFGDGFLQHVVPSLRNLIIGYMIGSVIGIVLGVAIGRVGWLRWLMTPIVEYARALPPPALLPFAILLLGIGPEMQVGIIVFGVVFVVLLNTIDGTRGVEPTLDDVATVYQIPRRYRLTEMLLPAASPQIVAGLRTGISLAVILMVVSEMTAATQGIGFFTLQAQQNFNFTDMWSGMVLLAVIGVLANLLFAWFVERPLLFWQAGANAKR
ncbi:ABC transporter permease [Microbacterium kribbense]|uniref:ABC transporter permease n=1 Tax=Microbacterium kribbense TaxID=433645 RepID=A0ABP7G7X7_9MICO